MLGGKSQQITTIRRLFDALMDALWPISYSPPKSEAIMINLAHLWVGQMISIETR